MKFWIVALLLVLLCGIAPGSLAAPAPESGPAATTILNPAFKQAVVAALGALHTAGYALRGKLVPMGEELLAVFLALSLGWSIFNGLMAQRLDAMFKDIINELIIALIALVLLWTWTGQGQAGGMSMSNFLTQGLNELVAPFISSANGGGTTQVVTTSVAEWQIVDDCFAAAGNIMSVIPKIWQGTTVGGTILNVVKNALQGIFIGEATGPGFAIAYIMLVTVVSLICALTVLTVMLFGLLYINLGDFIIYIGLAIGPVFVATLALPPIRQMFTRWLDFVLSGVFYKVIAVVIASFLPPLFAVISQNSTTVVAMDSAWIWDIAKNILGFLVYGVVMLFWSGFTLFLIKQVPTLAHSLIGGANLHVTRLSVVMPPLAKKAVSVVKGVAMAGLGAVGGVAGEASAAAGGVAGEASAAAGGAGAKMEYQEMTKQGLAENGHRTGAAQEFRDRMHKIKRRKALASMKGGFTDGEEDGEEDEEE